MLMLIDLLVVNFRCGWVMIKIFFVLICLSVKFLMIVLLLRIFVLNDWRIVFIVCRLVMVLVIKR